MLRQTSTLWFFLLLGLLSFLPAMGMDDGLPIMPSDPADNSIIKDSNSFAVHDNGGCSIYHRVKPIYSYQQKILVSFGYSTYGPISLVYNKDSFTYEYSTGTYQEDPFLFSYCKDRQVIVFYSKIYPNVLYRDPQQFTMFSREAFLLILDVTDLRLSKPELMEYALQRLDPDTRPKAYKMVCLKKFNMEHDVYFKDINGKTVYSSSYPKKHFPPKSIDDPCLRQFSRLIDLSDLQWVKYKKWKILKEKYKTSKIYNLKASS